MDDPGIESSKCLSLSLSIVASQHCACAHSSYGGRSTAHSTASQSVGFLYKHHTQAKQACARDWGFPRYHIRPVALVLTEKPSRTPQAHRKPRQRYPDYLIINTQVVERQISRRIHVAWAWWDCIHASTHSLICAASRYHQTGLCSSPINVARQRTNSEALTQRTNRTRMPVLRLETLEEMTQHFNVRVMYIMLGSETLETLR